MLLKRSLIVCAVFASLTFADKVFNVSSYGAVAGDDNDDRVAIQNAINAAITEGTGGIVYIPAGSYILKNKGLVIGNSGSVSKDNYHNLRIVGDGKFATELKFVSPDNSDLGKAAIHFSGVGILGGDWRETDNNGVENLSIVLDRSGSTTNVTAIDLEWASSAEVNNVNINISDNSSESNNWNTGVSARHWMTNIVNTRVHYANIAINLEKVGSARHANTMTISDCNLQRGQEGIRLSGNTTIRILDNTIEHFKSYGVNILSGQNIQITGNHMEGNGWTNGYNVRVSSNSSVRSLLISSNYFSLPEIARSPYDIPYNEEYNCSFIENTKLAPNSGGWISEGTHIGRVPVKKNDTYTYRTSLRGDINVNMGDLPYFPNNSEAKKHVAKGTLYWSDNGILRVVF